MEEEELPKTLKLDEVAFAHRELMYQVMGWIMA